MTRNVYFSPKASQKLESIIGYLEKNWTQQVTTEFIRKLDKVKKMISKYPESFPESQSFQGIYRCVITKHNSLYYRIKGKDIEIITIFDTRQNPKKLKKEIS